MQTAEKNLPRAKPLIYKVKMASKWNSELILSIEPHTMTVMTSSIYLPNAVQTYPK